MVELGWKLYMLCLGGVKYTNNILVTIVGTWYTNSRAYVQIHTDMYTKDVAKIIIYK